MPQLIALLVLIAIVGCLVQAVVAIVVALAKMIGYLLGVVVGVAVVGFVIYWIGVGVQKGSKTIFPMLKQEFSWLSGETVRWFEGETGEKVLRLFISGSIVSIIAMPLLCVLLNFLRKALWEEGRVFGTEAWGSEVVGGCLILALVAGGIFLTIWFFFLVSATFRSTEDSDSEDEDVRSGDSGSFRWRHEEGGVALTGMTGEVEKLRLPNVVNGVAVTAIADGRWNQGNPQGAFANSDCLTKVVLPTGLAKIGSYAFKGCDYLESVRFPRRLETIEYGAFYGCGNLKRVTIPKSVLAIRGGAFCNCVSLERIKLPPGVTTLERSVFDGCVSLERLDAYDGLTKIEACALRNCASLEAFIIPDSVTEIEEQAFRGCVSLGWITLPEGLRKLGAYAFNGCGALSRLILPKSLVEIGANPCPATVEIAVYPNSYAEQWARSRRIRFILLDGQGGEQVVIPAPPEPAKKAPHAKTPASSAPAPQPAPNPVCPGAPSLHDEHWFEKRSKDAPDDYFSRPAISDARSKAPAPARPVGAAFYLPFVDPARPVDSTAEKYMYAPKTLETPFVVPSTLNGEQVVAVGEAAFKRTSALKKVEIAYGVEHIENHAFFECEYLESVMLPKSVTTIGARAFSGCRKLRTVDVPASVTYIDDTAFDSTTIVRVVPGSYAAEWAKKLNHPFRALGAPVKKGSGKRAPLRKKSVV